MRAVLIKDGMMIPHPENEQYLKHRIISELTRLSVGYTGLGWDLVNPTDAFEATRDEFMFVFLPCGGVMAVSSNMPWFAKDYVLSEEWIGAGVTVEAAADALTLICREVRINRFEVGTRATRHQKHQAAARLYQQQGLRLTTITLEGVVNDEQETITQGDGSTQAT